MKTKKYKDFWVKIIGCLVASQLIDMLNREESLFQRLTSVYFYTDLLGGFVIALLLWETLRFVIRFLDKRYSWGEQPLKRTFLQIMFGVALPSLLSFVFTLLFSLLPPFPVIWYRRCGNRGTRGTFSLHSRPL